MMGRTSLRQRQGYHKPPQNPDGSFSASPAPSPGVQDVREALEAVYQEHLEKHANKPRWGQHRKADVERRPVEVPADLFDRLLAAIAQSDAQPVGWRDMDDAPKDGTAILSKIASGALFVVRWRSDSNYDYRWMTDSGAQGAALYVRPVAWMPLYTAPPSPDASAGLVEAAEELSHALYEQCKKRSVHIVPYEECAETLLIEANELIGLLRSRAADRTAPRSDKGGGE